MTYTSGGNDTEIAFVLVGKEKRMYMYLRDVKVILKELQHRLVVVDVEEQKLKKSVKKSRRVRWSVWKLKEKEIKEKFEERVVELEDTDSWICGDLIRMEFYRPVMNCVERRKEGEGKHMVMERASKGCNRSEKESV